MGSSYKKAIFDEHIQVGLVGWAQRNKGLRRAANGSSQVGPKEVSPVAVQLATVGQNASAPEESKAGEIELASAQDGPK